MIFDAHFHIIDPLFPLVENKGYLPAPFTVDDYLLQTNDLTIEGGVVVSGSFQSFDQSYLCAVLKRLGPKFKGVTQLPFSVQDEDIIALDKQGVCGYRFNLKRGARVDVSELKNMALRVYDLVNWHVELYIDARELDALSDTLCQLPAVSIDHLGLSELGFDSLLRLVEKGIKVKATGFARVNFDIKNALIKINDINPTALMFGTDLPSTRARRPFERKDVTLIVEALGEKGAEQVLYHNAIQFYGC
jgi:predicted TIM-barrel fold metal-dependent hydrolase